MDKTSNECCILIDGCTAIYNLHPDQNMKETSFKSIISINNFFEELNFDNKFFNKILCLYFSDFVACGLLQNTEYQSLLEKNLEELSNVNKSKSTFTKEGASAQENESSYVEQIENLANELMSASDFNYVFRINEHEIVSLKTKTLKTLLKVYMDQHLQNQKEKKEENLLILDSAEEADLNDINKNNNNNIDPKLKYQNLVLNFDVLNSILRKSDSRVLRDKAFTTLSQQNAEQNYQKLKEILKARLAYAKSLGFSSYAEYQMQMNGIKIHPNKLIDYLLNLWIDLRPNMILEYMDLYKGIKKENDMESAKFEENKKIENCKNSNNILDSKYLLNYEVDSLRASLIDLNLKFIDEKIISKKFITIGNILNGMQMLAKVLFNLDLDAVMDEDHIKEDLMHESILITNLNLSKSGSNIKNNNHNNEEAEEETETETEKNQRQNNKKDKIAKIYFDFFKREGKLNDVFSQFTIRGSKNLNLLHPQSGSIRQTPTVILATNFEVTDLDLLNMPISFTDARNILHEFGHVLHASLSKTDFQSVSGSRVPLDFAEIPSHFMEYFIFDYSFCRNFMIDNKTKVAMDEKLHGLLSSQTQMFANLDLQETLHLSVFDLIVHSITEEELFEKGNLEFLFNALIKYFYVGSIKSFDSESFMEFEALVREYKSNAAATEQSVNLKFPIDRFFNVLVEKSGSLESERGNPNIKSDYLAVLWDQQNAHSAIKSNKSDVNVLSRLNEVYKSKFMQESEEIEIDKKEKSKDKMFIEYKHDIKFNFEVNEFIEKKFEEEKFKAHRLEREKMYNKNLSFTTIPHFKNYPATYYSYVIGKIFANLIWTEGFFKENIDISRSGKILEEEYLSKGNTESSIKCIMNFLERLKKENKAAHNQIKI